ncbi:hypothetical protein FcAc13_09380 [Frischella sp. Ac13]|uniref:Uncharacterized protein n=1 Tax=Frischella japonica TaxID=2741544 RepID=A0ABR7QZ75_9GAMM|nr:hypothetical protein [Frischella japonica]MBC9131516.1 hypothetical protein [Frischella japonica]
MKYGQLISAVVLACGLLGCTDFDGSLKERLQAEYDRMNETGNRAICYLAGHVRFPYIDDPTLDEGKIPSNLVKSYNANLERLAKRLPLFAELGLLERQPVSEGSPYFRYSLTEEGQKALYFWPGQGEGVARNLKDYAYFCYGRRVILKVTDIEDVRAAGGEYVYTIIRYDNQLEGVPEWARDDRLLTLFQQFTKYYEGKTYKGSGRVIKKDGAYYNAGGIGRLAIGQY